MNAREFLSALASHSIVSTADVETIRDSLSSEKLAGDAELIAKEMVRKGTITKYQAVHVYKGRTKALDFGEYIVLDKLGAGGMGQVFKAQHRRMKRIVALKVLPPQMTNSSTAVKRFYQEVETAARLQHPNIVTAYDAGEAHGLHYLAMEYVDGKDLSQLLVRSGRFSIEQAMFCLAQAARGLDYAHRQGIVHRDIKPSNLLVDRRSVVKILDMGLARFDSPLGRRDDDGLTESGQMLGTVDYMSPEQAQDSRGADQRTDIYSLGCTMFRLLTDRVPYPADSILKKVLAHRDNPIPSLLELREDVPGRLDQLCQRMLAKDPNHRISSMSEVAATLDALLAGKSDEASSVSVIDDPVESDDWQSFLQAGRALGSSIGRATPDASASAGSSSSGRLTGISAGSASRSDSRRTSKTRGKKSRPRRPLPMNVIVGGISAAALFVILAIWLVLRGGSEPEVASRPPPARPAAAKPATAATKPPATPVAATKTTAPKFTTTTTTSPKPATPATASPTASAKSAATTTTTTVVKPPVSIPTTKPAAPAAARPSTPAAPTRLAASATKAPTTAVAATATTSASGASKTTPPASTAQPVMAPIDLLQLVSSKSAQAGKWSISPTSLVRLPSTEGNSRIAIAYTPPESYDLTLAAEGTLNENKIKMGLIVKGVRTTAILTPLKGLADVEIGMTDQAMRDLARRPAPLASLSSQSTTLTYAVRGNRVGVLVDGLLAADWTGNPVTLGSPTDVVGVIGDPSQLCLCVSGTNGEVKITRLEVTPPKTELPVYSRVDLLALYKPPSGANTGIALEHGDLEVRALSSAATSATHVELELPRASEYSVFMVVERTAGRSELTVGLPAGYKVGSAWLGSETTGLESFELIGEKRRELMPWRLHTVQWIIGAARTAMLIDGRPVVDAPRSSAAMAASQGNLDKLGVKLGGQGVYIRVSEGGAYRIRGIEITPANWRKLPRPSSAALAKAAKTLADATGQGTSPAQKLQAAQKLLEREAESLDDPAVRYAALESATTLAAGGDRLLACHAAIRLARTFEGDYHDLFERIAAETFRGARSPGDKKAAVEACFEAIDLAVAWGEFDLAAALQTAALTAAKPPTSEPAKELKARGIELAFDQQAAAAFHKALAAIEQGKASPAAHADAGRFLGLVRNDWPAAAREFEQADDASLRELARAEADPPLVPARQSALADLWWAWTDKCEPPLQILTAERAYAWSALAESNGARLAKTGLQQHKRLLTQQRRSSNFAFVARHPPDAVKFGNYWYKLYKSPVNWNMANEMCEEAGGSLPVITSALENQALAEVLVNMLGEGVKPECWLGLSDYKKEGTWLWTDGTPLVPGAFAAWADKQPDNSSNNENYARLMVSMINGQTAVRWADYAETATTPVLCQWRQ